MAARALATAFVNIVPGTQELEKYLKNDLGKSAGDAGTTAGNSLGGGMLSSIKRFAGPMIAAIATVGVTDFFKDAVTESSSLNESLNAVNVTFGENAAGILELGTNAAKAVGLSKNEFNGLAVQFSAFATSIAGDGGDVVNTMKDLTTRGADFASVMNMDVNDAMGLFQSGLAGETEPLRRYGIDLSAAAVQNYALANGIVQGKEKMSEAEKVQARYGLLMEQTAKTTGDFANTSDELANKTRITESEFKNASAALGDNLRPIMNEIVGIANNYLVPALQSAADGVKAMFGWFGDNQSWLLPLLAGVGTALLGISIYTTAVGVAAAIAAAGGMPAIIASTWAWTAALLANPVTWIVVGIAALVAAVVALAMNWDSVTAWVSEVWAGFTSWLAESFANVTTWWNELWAGIGNFVMDTWNNIVDWFGGALQWLVDLFLNWTLLGQIIKNWDAIVLAFTTAWNGIVDWFAGAIALFVTGWETAWTGIGDFIGDVFKNVADFVKAPLNAIIDLVNKAIDGINSISIDIPDWVPGLGGGTLGFDIPHIPKLALGGFVDSPTTALIGEAGPEVVTPLKDFERMMGLDGKSGPTVNYYAAPNQSIDSEQALFTAMRRAKVVGAW